MRYGYARASKGEARTQQQMLIDAGVDAAAIYSDESIAGVSVPETRAGWLALRRAAAPGDVIVVRELARLSRRRTHQVATLHDLHAAGIAMESLAPAEQQMLAMLRRSDSPIEAAVAEAVLIIIASIAEQDWIHTREAIVAGQQRARAAGKALGRPRVSDHDIEIIQMLAAAGHSQSEIARRTRLSRKTVARYSSS